jgi:hypothetical protein
MRALKSVMNEVLLQQVEELLRETFEGGLPGRARSTWITGPVSGHAGRDHREQASAA